MRRVRLELLVAVVAAAVAVTGTVASVDLRREQRLAEQQAAYEVGVIAVAHGFARAEAPLRKALSLNFQDEYDNIVRGDVFGRGNASADFTALDKRLQGLDVPSGLRAQHDRMRAVLAEAVAATATFPGLERPAEDLSAAADRFTAAADQWPTAAEAAVGPIPALSDLGAQTRPETHSGVLYRWSTSCVRALKTSAKAPTITDAASAAVALPWHATTTRDAAEEILDVPVPDADAARIERDIAAPLRQLDAGLQLFYAAADLFKAGQLEQAEARLKDVAALVPLFEQASRGLAEYGATTCAALLSPAQQPSLVVANATRAA